MELVAIAIAGAQALIALTGFVQWIEVRNQIQLAVIPRRNPGLGIGIVGARLIHYDERFAIAGRQLEAAGKCQTIAHSAASARVVGFISFPPSRPAKGGS